jgi:hypothetical protein
MLQSSLRDFKVRCAVEGLGSEEMEYGKLKMENMGKAEDEGNGNGNRKWNMEDGKYPEAGNTDSRWQITDVPTGPNYCGLVE